MAGITVTCYGVCGGRPDWRSKEGYCCSLCGGSGKVTTYSQRETALKEWESVAEKSRPAADVATTPAPPEAKGRAVKPAKPRTRPQGELFGGK